MRVVQRYLNLHSILLSGHLSPLLILLDEHSRSLDCAKDQVGKGPVLGERKAPTSEIQLRRVYFYINLSAYHRYAYKTRVFLS